mmetsp:Transcript_29562/g.57985  ORF Transcript_29562/g.57985 Transcript_29562/m.57985 type:complete len:128 (+) Transcript_29562:314-697(+)
MKTSCTLLFPANPSGEGFDFVSSKTCQPTEFLFTPANQGREKTNKIVDKLAHAALPDVVLVGAFTPRLIFICPCHKICWRGKKECKGTPGWLEGPSQSIYQFFSLSIGRVAGGIPLWLVQKNSNGLD